MSVDATHGEVILPDAPAIPGLRFRLFRDESDYPALLLINTGSKEADDLGDDLHTLDTIAHTYGKTGYSDPRTDILIAEVNGQPVAFNRVYWNAELDGTRIYSHVGFVLPEWRGKGIGRALIRQAERRLRQVAAEQKAEATGPRLFDTFVYSTQPALEELLKSEGYTTVRHTFDMVRPLSEEIPDLPLPEGTDVRPVTPEHFRAIWDANVEAFRDHWGAGEVNEGDFERWASHPNVEPSLWQVAWDGDQVAGMVLNFINQDYNKKYGVKRGYTEDIAVRRPWRKKGLARALITRSQRMFKEMGMTEVALGVDTENLSGALRLYESLGYRPVRRSSTYRKPLE